VKEISKIAKTIGGSEKEGKMKIGIRVGGGDRHLNKNLEPKQKPNDRKMKIK